jgi:hypothetical protein
MVGGSLVKTREMKLKSNSRSGISSFGIIMIAFVVILSGWLLRIVLFPAEQATRVYEKTLDADNVIYNYEYFKQAVEDISAIDRKIVTAQNAIEQFNLNAGSREKWDFRDKEESARLATNLTGLKNVREDMVATYNGRARMANRSIFMKGVPSSIDE